MALSWSFKTLAYFAVVFAISDLHGTRYTSRLNSVRATDGKDTDRPEIRIPQGVLRGINLITQRNRSIFGFESVPFAKPPLGELRFKGPLAPEPWNGTFDASRKAPYCAQIYETGDFVGDEDCLVLNVYTPRLPQGGNFTLLPVMVHMYGGAFQFGRIDSELFGPDYLLDKDVLLVLPNYRGGVLGFLSTGDEVSPGNYGLKDMVRALEWTRDNIQYFGGDPNRVTLFGSSAAATSIHYLTLSNSTNGLFHKYITQSGSALSLTMDAPTICKNRAFQLGKHLGCPTNSSTILIDCLRGLTVSQLVNTTVPFQKWKFVKHYIWVPTVEPDVEGAILTQNPQDLIKAGKSRDLPWLCGVTRDEGLFQTGAFYSDSDLARKFFDSIDSTLPFSMEYDDKVQFKEYWTSALKKYYLNDLTASKDVLLRNLTHIVGDIVITCPMHTALQQHLAVAKRPQYLYRFEYEGTFKFSYLYAGHRVNNYGVAHGDELLYLFPARSSYFGPPEYKKNENDWKMVDMMVELWTSFATTGTPSASMFNGTKIWEPFSSRNNYLQIGNGGQLTLENKSGFLTARMQFCKELYANTTWV